jgi:hypothetical protein
MLLYGKVRLHLLQLDPNSAGCFIIWNSNPEMGTVRAMSKFRDVKTLQKFGSIHASIHNHFNLDRHLNNRETFKQNRSAALAEWYRIVA